MRLHLLSDLHNEHLGLRDAPRSIEPAGADVIVLAGDIGSGLKGIEWAAGEGDRLQKPVVYVAGNHEFYGYDLGLYDRLRERAAALGVVFLENDTWVFNGVRFLGCTLWTDYRAAGDRMVGMDAAASGIRDHYKIIGDGDLFTPMEAAVLHESSRRWLGKKLAEPFAGKTVVVTHHGPHRNCQHPAHSVLPLSSAFWSHLDDLVAQADVWCYGHTHANVCFDVGKCRVVANQMGYPGEWITGFDAGFGVEV